LGGLLSSSFLRTLLLVASTAGNTLEDGLVVNLAPVGSLDLSAEANELLADGILGGGVEHLGLHLGGIGAPNVEANLLAKSSLRGGPLEVKDGITALLLGESLELGNEVVVGGRVGDDLVHNNLGEVAVHLKQDVSVLAAGLELVVGGDDIIGD